VPFAARTYQVAEAIVWVLGFLAAGLLVAAPGRSEGIVRENATTFMVVGMLTSYLGLLGTPIVTLTVPLMALAFSHADERGRRLAPRFILFATAWSVGYLACWAAKWVLVAVFTDAPGIVEEVVDQIRFRLSGGVPALGDAVPTVSGSILANLGEVRTGLVLTGLLIAASLPRIVRACRGGRPDSDVAGATLLVFALPFLWLAVVRNHSTIHSPFVAPILFTGFAIVAGFCLAPGHFLRRAGAETMQGAAPDSS
jgi:hypothetical protein